MKSLQNKLNLIKEGKGNKELFLKEARTMFPNVVTNALTFDQAVHNLTERGILSEGFIGISSEKPTNPDWFSIFNENVKADLKTVDKEVEELETAGYDYKDEKNSNNLSMESILSGYYTELKDPKNAEKTEEELKEMVVKNLTKDPLHYMKDGAFGVKGIGYTDKAPGLGATKEVTGKYASSGMEPVKLTESKSKMYELNEGFDEDKIAKYKEYTYTLGGKKVIPDDIDFYGHVLGVEIDGEVYRPGTPDEKGNIELKPRKGKTGMYTESKHSGEADLKIYKSELNMLNKIKATGEKHEKRKADLESKIADLEKKMNEGRDITNVKKGDIIVHDETGKEYKVQDFIEKIHRLQSNKLKVVDTEGNVRVINPYKYSIKKTKTTSSQNEDINDGSLEEANIFDKDPYKKKLKDLMDKGMSEKEAKAKIVSDINASDREAERAEKRAFGETLNEAKNKAMEKAVKEIENQSELAKAEAKLAAIDELISELQSKLSMTEAEGVSDMVDKKKVKEIQKNIKFLEAKKKRYDKEKSRLEGKYGKKEKEVVEETSQAPKLSYEQAIKEMLKKRGLKK